MTERQGTTTVEEQLTELKKKTITVFKGLYEHVNDYVLGIAALDNNRQMDLKTKIKRAKKLHETTMGGQAELVQSLKDHVVALGIPLQSGNLLPGQSFEERARDCTGGGLEALVIAIGKHLHTWEDVLFSEFDKSNGELEHPTKAIDFEDFASAIRGDGGEFNTLVSVDELLDELKADMEAEDSEEEESSDGEDSDEESVTDEANQDNLGTP